MRLIEQLSLIFDYPLLWFIVWALASMAVVLQFLIFWMQVCLDSYFSFAWIACELIVIFPLQQEEHRQP